MEQQCAGELVGWMASVTLACGNRDPLRMVGNRQVLHPKFARRRRHLLNRDAPVSV